MVATRAQAFAVFETAIGPCGIAWGDRGVVGVLLPEGSEAGMRARLAQRFPGAREGSPPAPVRFAMDGMVALLRGEESDLSKVALDMEGVPPFHRRVYDAARAIGPGATLSYGEVAARVGTPGAARAVGQALGRNLFAIVVPCHRVLAARGKSGGFSAPGGVTTKLRMLSIERTAPASVVEVVEVAPRVGGVPFDPVVAVEHLRASDPALARLIDAVGPFRMELASTQSLFVALAQAIVYQQLNGKAAATIFGRVCALFPKASEGPTPEHVLRTSDEKLRGAGLSRSKLLSLQDLARRSSAGEIPTLAEIHLMESEAIIERLTAVRGIGRWTVEMLLMFRLGRPDVLPADDYGIRKGFALTFKKRELPTRKSLEARGARWSPYRTVASWYLWRAVERAKTA
jgi:methylated-DNA-[protein]-cysteine S-methyltransferase